MDLQAMIDRLMAEGTFEEVGRNMRAQFGLPSKQYLGATLLPERMVPENAYEETEIRYRTVIANDGSRYSPAQKKGEQSIIGSFLVVLGNSDIAREFTSRDYDGVVRLLGANRSLDAMAVFTRWTDTAVNLGLVELNEKQRWDAIVNALVIRSGDNGYIEPVKYPNPSGHRVAAGGAWSNNSYDPYLDILAQAQLLRTKGYEVNRIITSSQVVTTMCANAKIQQRVGSLMVFNNNGTLSTFQSTASRAQLNSRLAQDNLPPLETYDAFYYTQDGTARFMPVDCMVMVATTGRQEELVFDQTQEQLAVENVLGYTAIGRAVGEMNPGRVIRAWPFNNKPPRVEAEGWQASLPVILEPEAIATITGIS